MATNNYHRLPIAAKRAEAVGRMRAPAITCPSCDTQVMPVDLLAHLAQRCPGRREPVPGDQWLTSAEVLELGVPKQTLSDWVTRDEVRVRGERGDREYLLRDVVLMIAQQRRKRRRESGNPDRGSQP